MFWKISIGDWLQSVASILGSIIAVGGVYWQVNKQAKKDNENQIKFKKFQDYFNLADKANSIIFDVPSILSFETDEYNRFLNDPFEDKLYRLLYRIKNKAKFLNKIYGYENADEKIQNGIDKINDKLREFGRISSEVDDNVDTSKFNPLDYNSMIEYTDTYKSEVAKYRDELISSIIDLSDLILSYANS